MNKWKILEVGIDQIVHSDLNANYMTNEQFDKLVNNIRETGCSSIIACYKRKEDGKYVIISGNHRYEACKKIGYLTMNILYANEEELSKDEIIALQLSHNSLHGQDDQEILKKLYDEIKDFDFKEFANIDLSDIENIKIESVSLVPKSKDYRVTLVLYHDDIRNLENITQVIQEQMLSSDIVLMSEKVAKTQNGIIENKEDFIDLISELKKKFKIKSNSVAFSKILEIAKQNL